MIEWPRRRARAMPSTVVARTGRISASTSRENAHSGTSLPETIRYADGAGTAGPVLSAFTVCSTAWPRAATPAASIGSPALLSRLPDVESSTAGIPCSPKGPCSVALNGSARCAICGPIPLPPARRPASDWTEAASVLRSSGGAS